MIRRLFVDNFRCFRNFELKLGSLPCTMIIGPNGAGKSSLGAVLRAFQNIGAGVADVRKLFDPVEFSLVAMQAQSRSDASAGDKSNVMRFEVDVGDGRRLWHYGFALRPMGLSFAVVDEFLDCDGNRLYDRAAQIPRFDSAVLLVPMLGNGTEPDEVYGAFRRQLRNIMMIKPVPTRMGALVKLEERALDEDCGNFASWVVKAVLSNPRAYQIFVNYLTCVMPDFGHVSVLDVASRGRLFMAWFKRGQDSEEFGIPFDVLSDGEKCQFVAAALVAVNEVSDNVVCFWDEPDNFITTGEIGYLLPALCHSFMKRGQLIVTSHSREAIMTYGENEIVRLTRVLHSEYTRPPVTMAELRTRGGLTGLLDEALASGKAVRE